MKFGLTRRIPSTTALLSFEVVARTLSMTQAAGDLFVSPGAVSRQISELEEFLGTQLFVRERQRLVLTPAGQSYAEQVRPLLEQLERVTLAMRSRQADTRHFHLSIAATFGNRWLLPRLADFYARYPDILLDISTRIGMPDFTAMRLDAALVYCTEPPPGFEGHKVFPLSLIAVAAGKLFKGGKVPKGLSAFERLPLMEQTTLPEAWKGYFDTLGKTPPSTTLGPRFDLLSMGHEVALAGLGVALLPGYLVADDLRTGKLVRVHPHEFETAGAYWLIYPSHQASLPWLSRMRDWLAEQVALDTGTQSLRR
jgi:LysR family transcriptional regulator, glycine cleavage system transcriptional activator